MSAHSGMSSERLDFRLKPEHKSLIERAAGILGQTVSSFANAALVKAADEVVKNDGQRVLSARDSQKFLAMLTTNEPNPALKAAAKRYKARLKASI